MIRPKNLQSLAPRDVNLNRRLVRRIETGEVFELRQWGEVISDANSVRIKTVTAAIACRCNGGATSRKAYGSTWEWVKTPQGTRALETHPNA